MNGRRSLCLLVVAEDPCYVGPLRLAVEQSGFAGELFVVSDGLEALRFLRRQGGRFQRTPRPDLIFLDIKMPGQAGLAFLATVKQDEQLRAIPVVILTAWAIEADVRAAYRLGVAGYVVKPADIQEFASAINKLCQYWFGRMRLPENCETGTGACMGNNE
jgi:CheY-like chemotaxis protein